jgi:hypothetical protein
MLVRCARLASSKGAILMGPSLAPTGPFPGPDVARAARRHRAVLPHLGNHTAAIEFGCLKAAMRRRYRNRTMVVKNDRRIGRGRGVSQSPQR